MKIQIATQFTALLSALVWPIANKALAMSCITVLTSIDPSQYSNLIFMAANGSQFKVRPATSEDIGTVTDVIHNAFGVWQEKGLNLKPMYQTDADTARHLIGKGFVVENSKGEIIATFSLEVGSITKNEGGVEFIEGGAAPSAFLPSSNEPIDLPHVVIFKKLAVKRQYAGLGLGSYLYNFAESLGRKDGYSAIVLETVESADWLYQWYLKLGFRTVGTYIYPKSQVKTSLMYKPLEREK